VRVVAAVAIYCHDVTDFCELGGHLHGQVTVTQLQYLAQQAEQPTREPEAHGGPGKKPSTRLHKGDCVVGGAHVFQRGLHGGGVQR